MLKNKALKTIAENILKKTKNYFDQTEVILGTDESSTIRFANNLIYQPISVYDVWLKIRLIKDKKIAVVNSNSFADKNIDELLAVGKNLCQLQKKDNNFISLPKPEKTKIIPKNSFDLETFKTSNKKLVKMVFPSIKLALKNKLISSGKLVRSTDELGIANSQGVWQYQPSSNVFFSTVVRDEKTKASGYGECMEQKISNLKIKKTVKLAIQTALKSKEPKKIKAQNLEVIFMPTALQEVLPYFAWLGPNARIYHEEVSFLKGKIGKKVFSNKLTITDEPLNPVSPAFFDFEGFPKKNLSLVKNGVPTNICYDSYYAQKYKKQNTGHGLPAPNTEGPISTHLVIKPGHSNLQQMIAKVKKGLLINRLWYIRVIHYKSLLLTGMTRDGTFYIENGKIKYPIQNLRFTDSIPSIFKNISEVGKDAVWQKLMWGVAKIPPIRITNFKFTS
ncbi:TldD/PmbA family protein [Patescibacteria group bacterium]